MAAHQAASAPDLDRHQEGGRALVSFAEEIQLAPGNRLRIILDRKSS
jgi:hypothetical protein